MRRATRQPVEAPVLCIGNFTVGGTGKTPTAIAFAQAAERRGLKPGILSRGHGGSFAHPHLVDPVNDSAKFVGDEPLLLAAHAPVAVTPNRAAGARLLIEHSCNFLIMDDGFQSARIRIDYALAIVDSRHGIGNGHVIPAGPLRAPLLEQLQHADGLLRMGKGEGADDVVRRASRAGKPIYEASTQPLNTEAVAGRRYLAFAGIGHPERFFMTAISAGAHLSLTRSFGDHHVYSPEDLIELEATARKSDLRLLTTAKDAARLRQSAASDAFLSRLNVLEIETVFEDAGTADRIIAATLAAWNRRKV